MLREPVGLEFDPSMLHWSAGPKVFDGVWAAHWYAAVRGSSGFAAAEGDLPKISDPKHAAICEEALQYYHDLRSYAQD
ncbi:MAG: hypothetical protein AAGP08_18130 [Pseudomonadota bacterium]